MAQAGQLYNQTIEVNESRDVVMQTLIAAATGAGGYTPTIAGPNSLILTRKYWPTWVIVVAIVGTLLFLIGLLALLIRNTETLTVTLSESGQGTRVQVAGLATPELAARLSSVLAGSTPVQGGQPALGTTG
jgi:hypothetical protein